MADSSEQPEKKTPRDAGHWAQPVGRLKVGDLSEDAVNINVAGRQVVSPLQGFGQLWQKTYSVRLSGATITPQEVIKNWKEDFPKFWPDVGRFYAPLTGIAPGEVGLISVSTPGGIKLSTGVMVMYADEESFAFMSPEGHMFAGWITFSAHESEKRHGRSGPGAHPRQRSSLRDRDAPFRVQEGGQVLAGYTRIPGEPLRCPGVSHDDCDGGGPEVAVVRGQERLAQCVDTLGDIHGVDAGPVGVVPGTPEEVGRVRFSRSGATCQR